MVADFVSNSTKEEMGASSSERTRENLDYKEAGQSGPCVICPASKYYVDMPFLDATLQVREYAVDSRATAIYGFIGAFFPLAVAAVSLRFYTRLRFSSLGKDDIALLVCLILYTGLVIATIYVRILAAECYYWHVVDICIWSIAELGSAITLTCVPASMPLVKHFFPAFMVSNAGIIIQWTPETNSRAQEGSFSHCTAPVNKDNSTTSLQLEDFRVPS